MPIGDAQNDNRNILIKNRFLVSQIGNETGTCPAIGLSCGGKCLNGNAAPANLNLHQREIWCRQYCKMPLRGYFNLRGQAVGLHHYHLLEVIFWVIWVLAIVMWVILTLCRQARDLSHIPMPHLWWVDLSSL